MAAGPSSLVLVTTCGLPGAGKSTLAQRLAPGLHARYVAVAPLKHALVPSFSSADCLREDLREVAYRLVMQLAEEALAEGDSVVIDGSFHRRHRRDWAAELAGRCRATWINLSCICSDEAEIKRRIEARQGHEADPWQHASTFSIYEAMQRAFQRPDPAESDALVQVDSSTGAIAWVKEPVYLRLREELDRALRLAWDMALVSN